MSVTDAATLSDRTHEQSTHPARPVLPAKLSKRRNQSHARILAGLRLIDIHHRAPPGTPEPSSHSSSLQLREPTLRRGLERLFDFRFLESNVLARDRVILLEGKLVGGSPGVFFRHIEEAGARG